MIDMKFNDIIRSNRKLENSRIENPYKIAVISNIMVHQIKDILEYSLRTEGIYTDVKIGDYDNIVQDSMNFKDKNSVIIFWELSNIVDNLQWKVEQFDDVKYQQIINKVKQEIDIVLNNLKSTPLIIFNLFSSLVFRKTSLRDSKFSLMADELNSYLLSLNKNNLRFINIDKTISLISINKSIDLRYYLSSKTLYKTDFYKSYIEHIKPIFLSLNGKTKKALILDCDNTLWKGVLGEDGFDKIKIFQEIQYMALDLSKNGVIIGLCSKNNQEDVDNVIKNHKSMILRDDDIIIKKVNWNDKVSNLKAISKELNIGLDSMVFVDDSDFEINLVRENLPTISTYQISKSEYLHTNMVESIKNEFYQNSLTYEDKKKKDMYKAQIQRVEAEKDIGNIEDYLKSLDLIINVYIDDKSLVSRLSQMTQKTNQFNLTTKRYSETEISTFIEDNNLIVIGIGVKDKFGDNGIVGLSILNIENNIAEIDTLLMSCRVLGRNIEYKFMDIIIFILKNKKINICKAKYVKTYKNAQVADLFDGYEFDKDLYSETESNYKLDIDKYQSKNFNYIGVEYGK